LICAKPKTTTTLLRLAPIKRHECVKNPASLAPKGRFIPTEAIECEIGQIGETQKAAGQLDSRAIRLIPPASIVSP
jgi:hypothetical protein